MTGRPEGSPEFATVEQTRPRGERRRSRKADWKKKPALSTTLATSGTVVLFVTWGKQWLGGEPVIRGPATFTFAIVATILGIALILASFAVGRSR